MSFRVHYRGLEVTCDTFAELDALADHARGVKQVIDQQSHKAITSKSEPSGDPGKNFMSYLQDVHRKTLRTLMASDTPVTDKDLRTALEVETNNQLGGYFSAITRAAKKAKFLEGKDIIQKTTLNAKTGERAFTYTIPKGTVRNYLQQYL